MTDDDLNKLRSEAVKMDREDLETAYVQAMQGWRCAVEDSDHYKKGLNEESHKHSQIRTELRDLKTNLASAAVHLAALAAAFPGPNIGGFNAGYLDHVRFEPPFRGEGK